MKFRHLPFLFAITAGLASTAAQAATTGTLRFVGQVNAGTCNLAAGDVNRTITLPTIKISDLASTVYAGAHDFNITADCESDIRNVIFLFTGTASNGNGALFSNTGTSQGIGLWLADRTGTGHSTIPANGSVPQRSRTIATSSSKAILPLTAAYYKTGSAITQGTLASAVTVSITYN
ncbi:type 1 fimbrial protein [Pseudomonas sp. WS 5106]|uniref:Type 1 fimbrial protein n=1 Tax=Pseudomonas cremoris TaxID=2724178 RepID=A0A7X1AL10_9PSED|nr:fimbrial protein [Pseudomonas cremoris]MBC2380271.1 type 1 fimbrial protein [Pseudomonas cremoris]MBC2405378.1 type 1 fimbrial protein [Pseudomonas cremoris]